MRLTRRTNSTPIVAHTWKLLISLPILTGCSSEAVTRLDSRDIAANSLPAAPSERPRNASTQSTSTQRGDDSTSSADAGGNSASSGRLLETTFDDIKFDIAPDAPFDRSMLTPEIESLAGKRIRIFGYMLPTAQKRGIKQFVLVRDNQECCFGPGAALYDCILVTMDSGETAEYSVRPVAVKGKFEIEVFQPMDRTLAVFHLKGEAVQP